MLTREMAAHCMSEYMEVFDPYPPDNTKPFCYREIASEIRKSRECDSTLPMLEFVGAERANGSLILQQVVQDRIGSGICFSGSLAAMTGLAQIVLSMMKKLGQPGILSRIENHELESGTEIYSFQLATQLSVTD